MSFKQPDLPYDLSALAPFVSEEQMDYHYNKHHATYFKKLNGLVEGKKESEMDLDKLVIQSSGGVFNNACLLYTSPSPRDGLLSRMPSSA